MRKRFEVQYEMGCKPIECIKIPLKSRDEIPTLLRGLQYIYSTPELNKKVFALLERKIFSKTGDKRTGRPGMSLWEILVLGSVRLARDADYDHLEHIANHDILVRKILGISTFGGEGKGYPIQTIKDNVSLLDEDTLQEINKLVVESGHQLVKKKDEEVVLRVKVDSYAVESNVHFPTDINLLWDAARKCIDLVVNILSEDEVAGWRKHADWRRRIKNAFIGANRVAFRGGRNREERIRQASRHYLKLCRLLSQKLEATKPYIAAAASGSPLKMIKLLSLENFEKMLDKHIDLVERRLIYGQSIPHEEKVFSLFEPYTAWIQKGKAGNKVELGLPVAVCTDQYGFILHHRVMEKEHDVDVAVRIGEILTSDWNIRSLSFDKGFWNKRNYEELSSLVRELILPKKGKLNSSEYVREHRQEFKELRWAHAAVESDINCLEHHGLDRCPDRGIAHFRNYVGLGVLAYNLHRLGKILIERDRETSEGCKLKAA